MKNTFSTQPIICQCPNILRRSRTARISLGRCSRTWKMDTGNLHKRILINGNDQKEISSLNRKTTETLRNIKMGMQTSQCFQMRSISMSCNILAQSLLTIQLYSVELTVLPIFYLSFENILIGQQFFILKMA
jgi:hypothetical protein